MEIKIKLPSNTSAFTVAKLELQLQELASLDQETLKKLVQLRKSKKAVTMLKEHWETIQDMLM